MRYWNVTGFVLIVVALLVPLTQADAHQVFASSSGWSRTYRGLVGIDVIAVTSDRGFIVAGNSAGVWVMKADALGNPVWERSYTPNGYALTEAEPTTLLQTREGGYILSGAVLSLGPSYPTGTDGWLLKLDWKGAVEWSEIYGGRLDDGFSSVRQTSDGGYVAIGNTQSFGSPLHVSNGWVVRVDPHGKIIWQETFEGQDIHSIDPTRDRGFAVAGTVCVCNATVNVAAAWVFKLDSKGSVVWEKAYPISSRSDAYTVQQTRDGGYVVGAEATTLSSVGSFLSSDALILKLDRNGDLLWQKSYSGGGFSRPYSTIQTSEGGFIVVGNSGTTSSGIGVAGPWLLKLDAEGRLSWHNLYGVENDFLYQVSQTKDKGFLAVGRQYNTDSAWVLRTDREGAVNGCPLRVHLDSTLGNPSLREIVMGVPSSGTNDIPAPTPVKVTFPETVSGTQCPMTPIATSHRHRRDDKDASKMMLQE